MNGYAALHEEIKDTLTFPAVYVKVVISARSTMEKIWRRLREQYEKNDEEEW